MGFLSMVVEDTLSSHPVIPIYIRGDANTNPNHPTRLHILQEFMERYGLYSFPLGHTTYHHFTGNGSRDSQLDVLISSLGHPDKLVDIKCKKDNPLVTSSHDVIISSFKLFSRIHWPDPTPKVSRPWYRVLWDNDGILSYSSILDKTLPSILASCGDAPSPETFLSILEQTNRAILDAANLSFKVKSLSQPHKPSKPRVDPVVKKLSIQISQLSVQIKRTTDSEIRQGLLQKHSSLSHLYTKAIRKANYKMYKLRDTKSNQILSTNPGQFYHYTRSLKPANPSLDNLEVGYQCTNVIYKF